MLINQNNKPKTSFFIQQKLTKMKKTIIIIALSLFILVPSIRMNAQPVSPVSEDDWVLNFGIGIGANYWGNGMGFGPGIKVAAEKGMWKVGPGVFTLGGEFGFSYFANSWDQYYLNENVSVKETWANIFLGARSAYHLGFDVKGLDVYAGIPLGIGFCAHSQTGWDYYDIWHGSSPVVPYLGIFMGGSYFFNDNLGINGEFGFNVTSAQVGMVFKLN
jgi:hypothetical protein